MGRSWKGITSNATIGSVILTDWKQYLLFEDWDKVIEKIENSSLTGNYVIHIPSFFTATFKLPQNQELLDTFLRLDGWSKGKNALFIYYNLNKPTINL